MSGRGGVTPDASKCGAPSARSHLAGPARPPATHLLASVIRIPSSCCARVNRKSTKIHRSADRTRCRSQRSGRSTDLVLASFAILRLPPVSVRSRRQHGRVYGRRLPSSPSFGRPCTSSGDPCGRRSTRFPLLLSRALTRKLPSGGSSGNARRPLAPRWRPQATLPAALGESLRPIQRCPPAPAVLGRDGPVPCNARVAGTSPCAMRLPATICSHPGTLLRPSSS